MPAVSKKSPIERAKDWKSGGDGETPLARSPETPPYVRNAVTDERGSTFLSHLELTGDVARAALLTDGNRDTRRTWLRLMAKDPAFAKASEDAMAAYSSRVGDVLRQEFFEGVMTPVVGRNGIVRDKDGNEVWIRKRDPKIVLALAKKHDFGLREIKTTINVDAGNPNAADPNDPSFVVKSSDLHRLSHQDMETLTGLLRKVHENRRETMAEITARPDYLDVEDVPYTEENTETDERYTIPPEGI